MKSSRGREVGSLLIQNNGKNEGANTEMTAYRDVCRG